VMGLLRRIIRYAVRRGICPQPEPARLQFDMPKVDNSKTECLTPEQARALLAALDEEPNQDLASLVRLALATGMRRGALLGLQWDDIDFIRGFITLRGEVAKKRKTETIPLTEQARAILQGVRRTKSPYVFPGRDGGPRKGLRRLLARVKKKAALPDDFRPLHGLRHTFASWLASSGQVDLYTLQRLLTHESPVMTQRYAHLADDSLRRAAAVADGLYQDVLKK
ncbi:MAG: site-specific integrase, partial [Desulfovibrionaceae bacterium]|nr:site-specific integrase [Desulfovibrionaceae bacterium]